MILTLAQLQALKADLLADVTLAAIARTADGFVQIATAYNAAAAPDFWIWRTKVTRDELVGRPSIDATTFDWTGTGYIARAQGERDAFNAIFDSADAVNPSLATVRQAFSDIFSGATAPAPANRTHLLTVARRKATRAEKLFATGTGSTVTPATLGPEGAVTAGNIEAALGS